MIGGKWDEIGALQFEYLKAQGLRPHHKLLDVGCGSLRGGVHFVGYLDAGGYSGLDINKSLLDAGYDVELAALGLQDRLPRTNLVCDAEFEFGGPDGVFDYAMAQSVFTHLSLNRIRQCLAKVARVMKPGGVFYATFFELPGGRSGRPAASSTSPAARSPPPWRIRSTIGSAISDTPPRAWDGRSSRSATGGTRATSACWRSGASPRRPRQRRPTTSAI